VQAPRQGLGRVAMAKGQKCSGHGATIGGAAAARKRDRVDFPTAPGARWGHV
jgi:hypothetical protein